MKRFVQCDVCFNLIEYPVCEECGFDNCYQFEDDGLILAIQDYIEHYFSSIEDLSELFGVSEELMRQYLEDIDYQSMGIEIIDDI